MTLVFILFILKFGFAQDVSRDLQKPPALDESRIRELWMEQPPGVQVGFGTASVRYPQQLPPSGNMSGTWKVSGWKNEKVNTQFLVWSKEGIDNFSWVLSELKAGNGRTIGAEAFSGGPVEYVMTDEFRDGCGYRRSADFDSSMVADIIRSDRLASSVAAMHTQPVWLGIQIPVDAAPGLYKATLTIKAGGRDYPLMIELTVVDRALPFSKNRTFQLDLWQHPAAIARVHNVPLWSNEHFSLMRNYYTMLASLGQKAITASIVDEPWNHQTYDDYPGLVKWTRKRDGSWKFDYTLFDKYVGFVMSCGIDRRINCYSMIPWKIEFSYYDEAAGKELAFTHSVGTDEYNAFWETMLRDFTAHLKKMGWFGITAIAMDERPMDAMKSVIALLKSIDPEWKIALAGDYHDEIEGDIYDYCLASRFTFPDKVLKAREESGKLSTWYTCCTEVYPNLFTFSAPDEGVWIGWYTAAAGFDGYLRWAYNSFTANPLKDSRFTAWPAGDTYQVYPGPLPSIRFEKLNEGIQDFEKIRLLREEYKVRNETEKLKRLEEELAGFKISTLSSVSAQEMVEKARILLNE